MRSLSRPEGCTSDLAFDELHAGELDATARLELEAHLSGCARCRDRRETLSRERDALLAAAPDLAALAPRPASRALPRRRAWIASATVLAMAAVALLVLLPKADPPDQLRSKGAPRLGMVIKRGERTFRADSGARVRPGDLVRFTYSTDRPRHLAVLGLDARVAQLYYPTEPGAEGRALRVPAGSDAALDFSVELDATPGDESVHGLFCDEPIELEPLRAALERTRALTTPSGCVVDTVILHKELAP